MVAAILSRLDAVGFGLEGIDIDGDGALVPAEDLDVAECGLRSRAGLMSLSTILRISSRVSSPSAGERAKTSTGSIKAPVV